MTHDCDFCEEFAGSRGTSFHRVYGADACRIVASSERLVAFPTLGQLFPASLLVVTRAHHETFARADAPTLRDLPAFLKPLLVRARQFGEPLIFEHGALSCTGASCGIYHAHIHIVPLPEAVSPERLLPEARGERAPLADALRSLRTSGQYVYVGAEAGVVIAREDAVTRLPSQCLRRRLASAFSLDAPWDWRRYSAPQDMLLRAVAHYGSVACS